MQKKILKFSPSLPELILAWKKDTTWRIWDNKNISVWDIISLCDNTWEEFAIWNVIRVKQTTFKDITSEDKEWHEVFSSEKEMYETYAGYYGKAIKPETELKVIKFTLVN